MDSSQLRDREVEELRNPSLNPQRFLIGVNSLLKERKEASNIILRRIIECRMERTKMSLSRIGRERDYGTRGVSWGRRSFGWQPRQVVVALLTNNRFDIQILLTPSPLQHSLGRNK